MVSTTFGEATFGSRGEGCAETLTARIAGAEGLAVSIAFGVAIFGAIMNARLLGELPNQLPVEVVSALGGEVTTLLSSPEAIRALPEEVAGGITVALAAAIQEVFLWAAPISAVGFALSWFLKEIPLRETVGSGPPVEGTDGLAP